MGSFEFASAPRPDGLTDWYDRRLKESGTIA